MKHRTHAYALVVGLVGLAGLIAAIPALGAHGARRNHKAGSSHGTYKSGLNRFVTVGAYENTLPTPGYGFTKAKVIPAKGFGSLTIKMRTVSRKVLLITGVTIKSTHVECVEHTNAEPPIRRYTTHYTKSIRTHQYANINTAPEKEVTAFDIGKLEHEEWLWEITIVFWEKPSGVLFPVPDLRYKPNLSTDCYVNGIAKTAMRFRRGAWQ